MNAMGNLGDMMGDGSTDAEVRSVCSICFVPISSLCWTTTTQHSRVIIRARGTSFGRLLQAILRTKIRCRKYYAVVLFFSGRWLMIASVSARIAFFSYFSLGYLG